MDVALLVNPAARSGAHSDAAARAAERLRAAGIRTTVVSGGSAAESSELLGTALDVGADAVLVAGGDGTVSLAIQRLAGTGIPLGIIPSGTGNDLATTVGLRELDAVGAADAVVAGATRRIDVARATRADGSSTLFGTVLASGFDSKVNDRANRMRWPRGHSRYNIAILIEFLTLRGIPYTVEATTPDGVVERIDGDLVMATVGNGRTEEASRSAPTPTRPTACWTSRSCAPPGGCDCCGSFPACTEARTPRSTRSSPGACGRSAWTRPG
jgi:diacylglycerol kinase (ATP)